MMPQIDFNLDLITDRNALPAGSALADAIQPALEGGVKAVQLREKDLCARKLFPLALQLRELTSSYGAKLLINDRIDIAMAVDADGVHLGGHSLPVETARKIMGPDKLIGVSTHHIEEIEKAHQNGADFATFGPVYYTPSKAPFGSPVGVEKLKEACSSSPLPVFALGGIKVECLAEIKHAGAFGAALISAILGAPDPRVTAQKIIDQLKKIR